MEEAYGVDPGMIFSAARDLHAVRLRTSAVVENDVSILQSITLDGTGKTSGDRHPKIRAGVMIVAGSVVLRAVPDHTTAAGVPTRMAGRLDSARPSEETFSSPGFEFGAGI